MLPKVSVTIAAYNCCPYIAQAIDSVLSQDFPSFEIIVVNDGSTDKTDKVLAGYRKNPLIRVINQKHYGQGWAKDRPVRAARGKYIALFDADDIMLPGRINAQTEILDKHPSFGACYGKAKMVDLKLRPKKDKMFGREFGMHYRKSWDLIRIPIVPAALMFRKSIYQKTGGFDHSFNLSADTDFMLKLAEKTRLYFLDEYLILYRRRRGTASHNKDIWQEESRARKNAIERRYNFQATYL